MNFEGVIESIKSRICLMVGRCAVVATKFADKELSADIELTAREKRRGVEYMQQFGFSSRPNGGVEGVALFIGGSRDNGVVVATRGDFPDLKEGEVMMHSPYGQQILLKNDGSVNITNKNGGSIVMASGGKVTVNGHLEVLL